MTAEPDPSVSGVSHLGVRVHMGKRGFPLNPFFGSADSQLFGGSRGPPPGCYLVQVLWLGPLIRIIQAGTATWLLREAACRWERMEPETS